MRVVAFDIAVWLLPGGIEAGMGSDDVAAALRPFGFERQASGDRTLVLEAGGAIVELPRVGDVIGERAILKAAGLVPMAEACRLDAPWYGLAGSTPGENPVSDAGCLASLLGETYTTPAVSHLIAPFPDHFAAPGVLGGRAGSAKEQVALEWGLLDGRVQRVDFVFGAPGPEPTPWLPPGTTQAMGMARVSGALLAGGWMRMDVNTFTRNDIVLTLVAEKDRWTGLLVRQRDPGTRRAAAPPALCAAMRDVRPARLRAGCVAGACLDGPGTFRTGSPFFGHGGKLSCDYIMTRFDGAKAFEGTLRCDGKEIWTGRFSERFSTRRDGSRARLWWPAGRGFWRGRDGRGPREEVNHDATRIVDP